MSQVSVRVDDDIKERAEIIFENLGLSMTAAINLFIRQAIRIGGIPFDSMTDPFYSEANMAHLRDVLKDAEEGKNMHAHELIEET
jgi:DNA-damage-inducible protein J